MEDLIRSLPKAELHLHIEGTLEPKMMLDLAARNNVEIPYKSEEEIFAAYDFKDLQSFLDIYYAGASVLLTEQDFYDLTFAYFKKCSEQNIVYAEIFFDPQTHTHRGVHFKTVIEGITRAREDAMMKFGIDSKVIMCFLRHLSEEDAMVTLMDAYPHRDLIYGVGLDSSEVGNPPSKFFGVFKQARAEGFECVAHAGEEGDPNYIWGALDLLGAKRIDHGVRCLEDIDLVNRLVTDQIPLTVCPLSNVRLRVFDKLENHNLKTMIDCGLLVTVNSDDPPYFGGYLNENLIECQKALNLSEYDMIDLVANSFIAAFLSEDEKDHYLDLMESCLASREVH